MSTSEHTNALQGFGTLLTLALLIPALAAIGAWCTQLVMKFPPRSAAAGITAVVFMLSSALELIPVTVAVTRLVRTPRARKLRNYVLTLIGFAAVLPILTVYLVVMLR